MWSKSLVVHCPVARDTEIERHGLETSCRLNPIRSSGAVLVSEVVAQAMVSAINSHGYRACGCPAPPPNESHVVPLHFNQIRILETSQCVLYKTPDGHGPAAGNKS